MDAIDKAVNNNFMQGRRMKAVSDWAIRHGKGLLQSFADVGNIASYAHTFVMSSFAVDGGIDLAEFADGRELMQTVRAGAVKWLPQRGIPAADTHRPDKVASNNGPAGPPAEAVASKKAPPPSEARPEWALVRSFLEAKDADFLPSDLHLMRAGRSKRPTMLWSKI
ncbi:hypothetical protein CYMTET_38177 [Cymbomonas tetramitiformis]|uniref:Uncharacterized protein n=1 Tax=Cymbomonas tetramitiformis TaxID=36881 RepID=A0AAE0CCH6_9CHLO|nr:hypothetical protein CYMTET_38179 [Cymbomonas tetramitiformis]KAK3252528.1 hypothetical protein CYMTET_38177 [Cymbomonas tetramitiformis]